MLEELKGIMLECEDCKLDLTEVMLECEEVLACIVVVIAVIVEGIVEVMIGVEGIVEVMIDVEGIVVAVLKNCSFCGNFCGNTYSIQPITHIIAREILIHKSLKLDMINSLPIVLVRGKPSKNSKS